MKDTESTREFNAEYGRGDSRKRAESLDLSADSLGQNCSPCCPQEKPQIGRQERGREDDALGEPLSINEVARLIGVSVWTVRHRYLAAGLPHLRVGYSGKLIFYTNQIIRWLLWKQQRGGTNL
jgi:hypothetical protein